jgi:cullin-associated NEDD8-dissociated protein 1
VATIINAAFRYQSGIPSDLPPTLVPQIKNYISTSEISLLSHSLIILASLLELSPIGTFPEVERDILPEVYTIAHSPLVSGAALDAILVFFAALVQADGQIATHIVPNLVITAEQAPKTESSPANVAKCIAQVVKSQQGIAAGTIVEFSKHIKVHVFYLDKCSNLLICFAHRKRLSQSLLM